MKEVKQEFEVVAFRMPGALRQAAKLKARAEDITFSQLMRRALKRELGHPQSKESTDLGLAA